VTAPSVQAKSRRLKTNLTIIVEAHLTTARRESLVIKAQAQISQLVPFARGLLFVLLLVAFASLLSAILILPKSVAWDPSHGILAAMQYEKGVAPDIRTIVTASAQDLSSLDYNRVTLWPPAYQAVPFALRSLGLTWGNAFRILIASCLVVGLLGWLSYFRLFVREKSTLAALMLVVLCSGFAVENATYYLGGDILLWSAAPLLIVLNVLAIRSEKFLAGLILSIAAGFCATAIYAIKFSGIFLAIGLFAAWILQAYRSSPVRRKIPLWLFGAGLGIVFLLAFGIIGGYTAVSPAGRVLNLPGGLSALGLWPMAMTHLDMAIGSLWDKLNLSPDQKIWIGSAFGGLLIIGMVVLGIAQRSYLASFLRRSEDSAGYAVPMPVIVALCVIAVDTFLLAATIFLGSHVEIGARLARVSGLLALPLVFTLTIRGLSKCRGAAFVLAAAMTAVVFIAPPFYGMTRFLKHIRQIYPLRERLTDNEGLVCQHFGDLDDVRSFTSELRSHVPSKNTILYTTYPNILFLFPTQRCLLVEAVELFSVEQLRRETYVHPPGEGVALFLPRIFENDGKLAAIEQSFREIDSWEYVPMKSMTEWGLWISRQNAQSADSSRTKL
jgi:hypothetical protein